MKFRALAAVRGAEVADELEVVCAKAWSRVERWEASGLACETGLEPGYVLESFTGEPVTMPMMALPMLAICWETLGFPASETPQLKVKMWKLWQEARGAAWCKKDNFGLLGTVLTTVCLITRS